jgi:hypothetical protein
MNTDVGFFFPFFFFKSDRPRGSRAVTAVGCWQVLAVAWQDVQLVDAGAASAHE